MPDKPTVQLIGKNGNVMEITTRQIQLIQDVYGNAKSMRRQIAGGEENVNELSEIEYARS